MKTNLALKHDYTAQEDFYSSAITEAALYHQAHDFGFFTLGWSFKSGRQLAAEAAEALQQKLFADDAEMQELKRKQYSSYRQQSYKLTQLHEVLKNPFEHIKNKDRNDTIETSSFWLSQAEFSKPNRQKINLLRVGLCWVDIDTHHENSPAHETTKQRSGFKAVSGHLRQDTDTLSEPCIMDRQGLAAKWIFDHPLPKQAYPRWSAVQNSLVDTFGNMGADDNAKDASRVLRLSGTYNPKSLDLCHPIYINDHYGDPKRISFDDLANAILPYTRQQLAELKASRQEAKARKAEHHLKLIEGGQKSETNLLRFSPPRLAWLQVDDYRKIARLRPVKQRSEGFTDNLVWLAASALAVAVWANIERFEAELNALVRELAPHWDKVRIAGAVSSVRSRAEAMARGEWVTYNGRKVPPVYTPKHSTIIDMLGITDDEMQTLDVIISEDIKKDRHRQAEAQRRREAGAIDRETYLMTNTDKKVQAVELVVNMGKTTREAGEILGVNHSTIVRWLKKPQKNINSVSVVQVRPYTEVALASGLNGTALLHLTVGTEWYCIGFI